MAGEPPGKTAAARPMVAWWAGGMQLGAAWTLWVVESRVPFPCLGRLAGGPLQRAVAGLEAGQVHSPCKTHLSLEASPPSPGPCSPFPSPRGCDWSVSSCLQLLETIDLRFRVRQG